MRIAMILTVASMVFLGACSSAPPKVDEPMKAATSAPMEEATSAPAAFTEISVEKLAQWIENRAIIEIYDANGDETRAEFGTIPGATLIDSSNFDTSTLPDNKSKKLVFYCSSESCTAAPSAAEKAASAGHTEVLVLRVGIKGWVAANQAVDKVK